MLQPGAVYEYEDGKINIVRVNNAYIQLFGRLDADAQVYSLDPMSVFPENRRKQITEVFEESFEQRLMKVSIPMPIKTEKVVKWIRLNVKYVGSMGKKESFMEY